MLKKNQYHPKPVRRTYILKQDGRKRPLGIPIIKDRIVQMAAKLTIEPIFEADFLGCSYSFRPKRSAKQAMDRIFEVADKGNALWVIDADIRDYFGSISHEKLMLLVEQRISDRRVLKLIRKWLKAGIMEDGAVKTSTVGIPQGGVISPLLSNIYLHYCDKIWMKRFEQYGELVRYADDFVILCKRKKQADEALKRVTAKLQLQPEEIIKLLNPKIVGMRNYYNRRFARPKLWDMNRYILKKCTRWYNRKHQNNYKLGFMKKVCTQFYELGLERMSVS